jgi:hypothetical protein
LIIIIVQVNLRRSILPDFSLDGGSGFDLSGNGLSFSLDADRAAVVFQEVLHALLGTVAVSVTAISSKTTFRQTSLKFSKTT